MTLGLTSQRELDAAVAKAAKARGAEAPVDTTFNEDRAALIEELRAERETHAREAEAALAAAKAASRTAPRAISAGTLTPPSAAKGVDPQPAAAAAPDASLADTPYSHKGLTYPLGRDGPGIGEVVAIADGVGWTRSPVPGSLNHINLWLLEDGEGVAIVDTGLDIAPAREAWEAQFAGPLAGRAVTRVICTHFHPDHIGLAGWLTERFGVRLWMTRGEWLFARMLTTDVREAPPAEAIAYWRAAGWSEERIAEEAAKGWGRFASVVSPVPVAMVRMQDGDEIADRRPDLAGGGRLRPFARTCLPGRRRGEIADRRRPGAAPDHLQRLARASASPKPTRSASGSIRSRS